MSLQIYADQMKSIDPSAKMVKDVLKCQYNNHAVTVPNQAMINYW